MNTLADFDPLRPAEETLLKNVVSGEFAIISQTCPKKATPKNTVRASFIRWLALGGDAEHPLHAHGVHLVGAYIVEQLDLMGAQVKSNLTLVNCYLKKLELQNVHLDGSLNLSGCQCEGISADAANITGNVFLREGFNCDGEVYFLGASIGGNLECCNATFNVPQEKPAISADGARIAGGVFLREGFECNGEVRLLSASIGGDLVCSNATFNGLDGQSAINADRAQIAGSVFLNNDFNCEGEVRLVGASIGGDLECGSATFTRPKGQSAINADRAQIAGSVFLINDFNCEGKVHLTACQIKGGLIFTNNLSPVCVDASNAHVAFLQTDLAAWAGGSHLAGFSYDGIREFNWSKQDCLNWLAKQRIDDYGNEAAPQFFKPQPWQQLIKTLRRMGHKQTADEIAIAFEQQLCAIGKINGWFKCSLHWLFGKLAGYGYQPMRLVKSMLGVWFALGVLYTVAAYVGVFAPSDPLIFQNRAYNVCSPARADGAFNSSLINNAASDGVTHNWYTCGALMGEYTTFSPFIYSLDVILPLVDLGQEKAWGTFINTPKPEFCKELKQISWNHATRCLIWLEILFGWVASLILVAVLTGLTNREK